MMKAFSRLMWVLIAFVSTECFAEYPWVTQSSEDFKVIVDPGVEANVRLQMVQRAMHSIDIVTYDQRADKQVGRPLLAAIRHAANRGVKVRFLTAWSAQLMKDPLNQVKRFLTSRPTTVPIEFHTVGGPRMLLRRWGSLDGIHEKLFIVDGKWALITGRGHADEYLNWVDTGFAFKGPLVEQSVDAYDNLWNALVKNRFIKPKGFKKAPKNLSMDQTPKVNALNKLLILPAAETKEVEDLTAWLDQPSVSLESSTHTYQARLIHFNLIEQLGELAESEKRTPFSYSYEERVNRLTDPIVEELIALVSRPGTESLDYYTLSTLTTSKLENALIQASQRGVNVSLLTNGFEAQSKIVPFKMAIGWYAGLKSMIQLLDGNVHVYAYQPKSKLDPIFVHRKLAVTGDTVLCGSHNLNLASSSESDEINIEIRDATFAEQARQLFRNDAENSSQKIDHLDIHEERDDVFFEEWFSSFFRALY